jgi:serine/threonine protein kinase
MTQASVLLASRYRLEALIAAGGIGEVWRAQDLVLDRPVAVKMLRSEYAGSRRLWRGSRPRPGKRDRCLIRASPRSMTTGTWAQRALRIW